MSIITPSRSGQIVSIEVDMRSVAKLLKKLDKLNLKMQRKIANPAVRAGAKICKEAIKKEAPVQRKKKGVNLKPGHPGLLKKALQTRIKKGRKRGVFGYNVLFNIKKYPQLVYYTKGSATSLARNEKGKRKSTGRRHFIPADVEYGHGHAKKNRFMKRGFELSRERALARIRRKLWVGLTKEARGTL